MEKWRIFVPYLITWVLFEIIAVVIYFTAVRDNWVALVEFNVALIPLYFMCFFSLHSRCPICGKRHLIKVVRCGGDRYTLYDAYCPVHKKWIDITWDRQEWKTTYLTKDDNERWNTIEITPIWEQKKKEKFDWVLRNINYLELEKDHWTAKDLAERSRCSVRYAKKVIKSMNI